MHWGWGALCVRAFSIRRQRRVRWLSGKSALFTTCCVCHQVRDKRAVPSRAVPCYSVTLRWQQGEASGASEEDDDRKSKLCIMEGLVISLIIKPLLMQWSITLIDVSRRYKYSVLWFWRPHDLILSNSINNCWTRHQLFNHFVTPPIRGVPSGGVALLKPDWPLQVPPHYLIGYLPSQTPALSNTHLSEEWTRNVLMKSFETFCKPRKTKKWNDF